MMTMRLYSVTMLGLSLLGFFLGKASGMADLSTEMLSAKTLQELRQAEKNHEELRLWEREQGKSFFVRRTQEEGLEDSQHILADAFGAPGFYHGVASGDPLPDAVIIWTRYTPSTAEEEVELELRMAQVDPNIAVNDHLDVEANPNLRRAKVTVTASTDFVAKIDVTGLPAGQDFVFAFSDGTATSMIGRTKTAPGPNDEVERMTYAAFSCAHFANGYFHAYDIASTIKDIDFWIHLGDYVYEYGLFSTYASDSPERKQQILPVWEQISLQDHRNRMATYHTDEGLQNLRARAPLIATWDDHETTNNPWGDGTLEGTGAENHQEICPVGPDATDEEKAGAQCDRDEGPIDKRFNDAAQSYFEWMPIRHQEGQMGVVTVGDIVQKVSWGDMATIVTFDTRLSHRSKDPTLNSSNWGAFFPFAGANTDVSQYSSDPLMTELSEVAEGVRAVLESDEFTMIGEDIDVLTTTFQESKDAGQPWQIWATATALGRAVKGDYYSMASLIEDETTASEAQQILEGLFGAESSTFFRALSAMAMTDIPWNRDDYSGFAHEQRKILAAFKDVSTNPIVLGGDLHDGYAWQLYEGGDVDGTPSAVNLVCPGVTSPGWGPALFPAFSSLSEVVGGSDMLYDLIEAADEKANAGLKYFNMQYKGFFAVTATKEKHVAEFFVIDPEVVLTSFEDARGDGIVADFKCDAQLTTMAGEPGSLVRSDECSTIVFETERAFTDMPFPNPSTEEIEMELANCGYTGCEFAVKASSGGEQETERINATFGSPRAAIKALTGCEYKNLDVEFLIEKYTMNMTDPSHLRALSDVISGRMAIGSHTQLIPEANDAARTGALVIDGLTGDSNFPHGGMKALITVGEINMCDDDGHGEVYTGVPDGMGAYLVDEDTVRIVVQSESYGPLRYETWPYFVNDGAASFTGSHVHTIDYDRAGLAEFMTHSGAASEIIKGFGPAAVKYYNLAGEPVGPRAEDGPTITGAHFSNTDVAGNYVITGGVPTRADWLMQSLCSAHMEEKHQWGPGIGFEDNIYITNEEWIQYIEGSEFVGISMHAINMDTKEDWAVGAVTQTGFEKIVELNPQSPDYVVLGVSGYNGDYSGFTAELDARNAEYGPRDDGSDYVWTENIVPARIYIGVKGKMEDGSDASADDFLARNGLRYGKLYGFATDIEDQTEGLYRDDWHTPRENGAKVDGKFVAIPWQWDGVVKNFRHDGAWDFQNQVPGYEGTSWSWWNANGLSEDGSKTEHLSPALTPGVTSFVQGSTAGYFGHYYLNDLKEALEAANGGLPAEIDSTYFNYQGQQDVSGQIELNGAGLLNEVPECPGASDATVNCDNDNSVKNTFEDIDGLEVFASAEGLYAIIQEDSGNELGERMFIVKLEHEADGQELTYRFMAQSGGKYNTRMAAGVGVPAETNPAGASHEFSGLIDLSGMLAMGSRRRDLQEMPRLKNKAAEVRECTEESPCEICEGHCESDSECSGDLICYFKTGTGGDKSNPLAGAVPGCTGYEFGQTDFCISPEATTQGQFKKNIEAATSICDKLIAIGLQSHNLFGGSIEAFSADRGGQILAYKPDLPECN